MKYVVTTTIHVPHLLNDYVYDYQKHAHDYTVVVAGDKKTPASTAAFCRSLPHVVYLDVADQQRLFNQLPLHDYIPFNSMDRRNFAYLYCLQHGFTVDDVMVTIDDDNFLHDPDFLGQHSRRSYRGPVVRAVSPTWYNPLPRAYKAEIYPRGYSLYARYQAAEKAPAAEERSIMVAVNQGLWHESPDLDALSRFMTNNAPFQVQDATTAALGENILCPFDTQNTSYLNAFGITAFLCPYIGRFDDIFSSFITKRIADHLGFGVTVGGPVVTQHRNPHSTYHDFLLEVHGMSHTDTFASLLYTIPLSARTVRGAYAELADKLTQSLAHFPSLHQGQNQQTTLLWSLSQIPMGMKLWLECLDRLNVTVDTGSMAVPATTP